MTLFAGVRRSLIRPLWSAVMATGTRRLGSDAGGVLVAKSEVTAFIERCMVAVGTKPAHANALADNLTMADYRGHFSHGLNRLGELSVDALVVFNWLLNFHKTRLCSVCTVLDALISHSYSIVIA